MELHLSFSRPCECYHSATLPLWSNSPDHVVLHWGLADRAEADQHWDQSDGGENAEGEEEERRGEGGGRGLENRD